MTKEQILKRLLGYLPNHYKKESGSNNYQFLLSFANNINNLANQKPLLKNSIQINSATGNALDDVGELFKLSRNPQETDNNFRSRIKSYWSGLLGGGTINSISTTLANLLDISKEDITITSNYANMQIDIAIGENSQFTILNNIRDNINQIKGAGIGLQKITFSTTRNILMTNISKTNKEVKIL